MPARRDFPIDADYAGGRLETFLRQKLGLPRGLALKALRKGWVRLSGHRAKGDARLESGSVVTITNPALTLPGLDGPRRPPAPRPDAATVKRAAASIVFRDDLVLVSDKPWGEVVHAGTGHASGWVDALRAALADLGVPAAEAVPIGRLDRDTSGLLLVALTRASARELFAALRAGTVQRTYTALVGGRVAGERGTIDAPLAKLEQEDGREQVQPDVSGKPAVTHWEVVRRLSAASLVRCRIDTGRTHQIRAHMASIGHPVLGDPRQGGERAERLLLHAGELEFPHPRDGVVKRFELPAPFVLSEGTSRGTRDMPESKDKPA